jgi:hypothetical protein
VEHRRLGLAAGAGQAARHPTSDPTATTDRRAEMTVRFVIWDQITSLAALPQDPTGPSTP